MGSQWKEVRYPLLHNKSWLMARYLMEGKKVTEIQELAGGASYSTVINALAEHKIYDPIVRRDAVVKTREQLFEVASRHSAMRQVWMELGITRATLGKCCHRAGISMDELKVVLAPRPPTARDRQRSRMSTAQTEKAQLYAQIEDWYVNEDLTIDEIGARLGRHPSGIFRILKNRGVDTTDKRKAKARRGLEKRLGVDVRRWPMPFVRLTWTYRSDTAQELAALVYRLASCADPEHQHLYAVNSSTLKLHMQMVSLECLGLQDLVDDLDAEGEGDGD